MALPDTETMAAIAVTRFGFGARPGEIAAARPNPKAFLKAQIRPAGADQPAGPLPDSATRLNDFRAYQQDQRQARADPEKAASQITQMVRQQAVGLADEFGARTLIAMRTDAAFRERWTQFWANHFTVSATKLVSANQAGPFEREAIRPHVFGIFEEMLLASSTHPGMLLYLDQAQSIGPDSMAANRQRGRLAPPGRPQAPRGLNENLAREIMELHTVGVGAGYTQADVTEFARAMTGWSVGGDVDGPMRGKFVFRQLTHQPGPRTVMGKRYPDTGGLQAFNIMRDLAAHPATAQHVAVKLARHFVADDPPPTLVKALRDNFVATGGRLDKLAETLIDAPESWSPQPAKFKTPNEFLISSWRAVDQTPRNVQQVVQTLTQFGQRPFSAPSPKGWADDTPTWASPDAMIKRLAYSEGFAAANARVAEPVTIAQSCLGARLTPPVAAAMASAESRQEALTILLMSPEFQRR